jgi:hypothetical protein
MPGMDQRLGSTEFGAVSKLGLNPPENGSANTTLIKELRFVLSGIIPTPHSKLGPLKMDTLRI